jgi:hypothetical protein
MDLVLARVHAQGHRQHAASPLHPSSSKRKREVPAVPWPVCERMGSSGRLAEARRCHTAHTQRHTPSHTFALPHTSHPCWPSR